MRRVAKWLVIAAVALVLLLGAVALALAQWTGSADFRERIAREATAALGVPVRLTDVSVDLWPVPAVALTGVAAQSTPAITLGRVEARPVWSALLQGRLEVATLVLRQSVLPQAALAAIAGALQKKEQTMTTGSGPGAQNTSKTRFEMAWLPRRVVLEDVTWVNARGRATAVDAEATLAPDGWPQAATLQVRKGGWQGARVVLARLDPAAQGPAAGGTSGQAAGATPHAWSVKVAVGGGTVQGRITVKPGAGQAGAAADTVLDGALDTRDVEVAALTAPGRTLSGRLDASTTLNARVRDLGALGDALQTQTRFTVRNAVVHGIDLARAVSTVGLSRGGETALDALAGQVNTRGQTIQLTNLVASSGVLAATGQVTVAPSRALSGRVNVDLTRGASRGVVSVPLAVGGTLDAPEVTLTRGALLGAAIGTAVMPGAGTAAGASIGDRLGQGLKGLFGK